MCVAKDGARLGLSGTEDCWHTLQSTLGDLQLRLGLAVDGVVLPITPPPMSLVATPLVEQTLQAQMGYSIYLRELMSTRRTWQEGQLQRSSPALVRIVEWLRMPAMEIAQQREDAASQCQYTCAPDDLVRGFSPRALSAAVAALMCSGDPEITTQLLKRVIPAMLRLPEQLAKHLHRPMRSNAKAKPSKLSVRIEV